MTLFVHLNLIHNTFTHRVNHVRQTIGHFWLGGLIFQTLSAKPHKITRYKFVCIVLNLKVMIVILLFLKVNALLSLRLLHLL